MNIKEQAKKYGVCDLVYAKKLEKLGVKQKSLWYWLNAYGIWWIQANKSTDRIRAIDPKVEHFSGFTVSELGKMLPEYIDQKGKIYRLIITKYIPSMGWVVEYRELGHLMMKIKNKYVLENAQTEANARAKMLIYLIKEGVIKV